MYWSIAQVFGPQVKISDWMVLQRKLEKSCQDRWEEKQDYKKLRSPGEHRAARREEWPEVSGAANKL